MLLLLFVVVAVVVGLDFLFVVSGVVVAGVPCVLVFVILHAVLVVLVIVVVAVVVAVLAVVL